MKSDFILAGVELALRLPLDNMDYMGNGQVWVSNSINVSVIICVHDFQMKFFLGLLKL